jgi:hypothetical protein
MIFSNLKTPDEPAWNITRADEPNQLGRRVNGDTVKADAEPNQKAKAKKTNQSKANGISLSFQRTPRRQARFACDAGI